MKKHYFNLRFGRLCSALLLLALALIIHSCRKDHHSNDTDGHAAATLSPAELTTMQSIYQLRTARATVGTNARGEQSGFAMIRNMNVKWDRYVINNRSDSSHVVEFDMQRDSGTILTRKLNINDTLAFRNKTCAVFIKYANG